MQAPIELRRPLVFVTMAAVLAACATEPEHHYFHREEQAPPAEWGYEGEIGPERWGDLSPDYALAKSGIEQSPIDLYDGASLDLPEIDFHYRPTRIDLVYNGHTVEQEDTGGCYIEVGGNRYTLAQFHFHSPSEHTVNGRHAEMELHLVHKDHGGNVAVVSVLIEEGSENPAFAPVWSNLPTDANRKRESAAVVDPGALLPADRGYLRYMGSFTTPPCTEGVLWLVLRSPGELSAAQIAAFRAVLDGNNRPVQPLNGRAISVSR